MVFRGKGNDRYYGHFSWSLRNELWFVSIVEFRMADSSREVLKILELCSKLTCLMETEIIIMYMRIEDHRF